MNESYIVSGVFFGDEGKGSIIDYLAYTKNIQDNVRYNGGSQASHTVVSDNIKHKCSQLGSNILNKKSRNYLSEYTIVNPFNIFTEAQVLSKTTGEPIENILKRIYISKNARIVTPYHKLVGQLIAISHSPNKRGSVGTGVSQTTRIYEETGIEILMSDLVNLNEITREKLRKLFEYTREFYQKIKDDIDKELFKELISKEDIFYLTKIENRDYIFECYTSLMNSKLLNIVNDIKEFHQNGNILFEGSQGLLIDRNYGIRPNTTLLDTTNHNGIKLSKELDVKIYKIGAITPFTSRHGIGILPTFDAEINDKIYDENQSNNYFQGKPRYGWFDVVLAKYSNKINQYDELFMTQIDRLSNFEKLKVCIFYTYYGEINNDFKETFDYKIQDNEIIIKSIKQNSIHLKEYLYKCKPNYLELPGWKQKLNVDYIPRELNDFLYLIEIYLNKKITYLGIGEDRNMKLERKKL